MILRNINLTEHDYEIYKELMSSFGDMSNISYDDYINYANTIIECGKFVLLAEDDGKIVGSISAIIEPKIFHKSHCIHIEDVVVKKEYRKLGYGKKMIHELMNSFKQVASQKPDEPGIYKFILTCKEENVGFYESLGFRKNEVEMRLDVDD